MEYGTLTHDIIGRAFVVYNELGYGFLEKVYENSLAFELNSIERATEQQKNVTVYYKGEPVGFYTPDLIIEDKVVVELNTSKEISSTHRAQLQNYLRSTDLNVGLILNFRPDKLEYRRIAKL